MVQHMQQGNFEVCIQEAEGFLETAQWCSRDKVFMSEQMRYPFVVNISFACELYIKAIMIYESKNNSFIVGHNLLELFTNMSPIAQAAIRDAYERKAGDSLPSESLEQFLGMCKNDFKDWRYAFQKGGLTANASNYLHFVFGLKDYVEEIKKTILLEV